MNKINRLNAFLLKIGVISLVSLALSSCVNSQHNKFDDMKLTQCASPKSAVCTKEFKPVCGFETDGNHSTFSNACVACSTADIKSYDAGACK